MASTSKLNLGIKFADGETIKASFGDVTTTDLNPNLKSAIVALNTPSIRSVQYPGFDSAFVSSAGADFVSIVSAEVVTTEQIVVF